MYVFVYMCNILNCEWVDNVIIVAPTFEEFDIEVTKGSGPLGLKVMGGADTKLKDVVIKEIVPNSQADIDGQLRPGDQILKVPNL